MLKKYASANVVGFAGALVFRRKKCKRYFATFKFEPEPSQPRSFSNTYLGLKKGKGFWCLLFYGLFLRTIMITTPTKTIAIIMATTAGTKYISTGDAGAGVGAAVGCGASSTSIAVTAVEP